MQAPGRGKPKAGQRATLALRGTLAAVCKRLAANKGTWTPAICGTPNDPRFTLTRYRQTSKSILVLSFLSPRTGSGRTTVGCCSTVILGPNGAGMKCRFDLPLRSSFERRACCLESVRSRQHGARFQSEFCSRRFAPNATPLQKFKLGKKQTGAVRYGPRLTG